MINSNKEQITEGNIFSLGKRFRVIHGSGVDSNKIVTIVDKNKITTDGRGIPTNVQGAYKPVNWNIEVAIQYPDGKYGTMYKNRLIPLKPGFFEASQPGIIQQEDWKSKYNSYYEDDFDDWQFDDFIDDFNDLCTQVFGSPPYHIYSIGSRLNWRNASGDMSLTVDNALSIIHKIAAPYKPGFVGVKLENNADNKPFISMDIYHHDSRFVGGPTHVEMYNAADMPDEDDDEEFYAENKENIAEIDESQPVGKSKYATEVSQRERKRADFTYNISEDNKTLTIFYRGVKIGSQVTQFTSQTPQELRDSKEEAGDVYINAFVDAKNVKNKFPNIAKKLEHIDRWFYSHPNQMFPAKPITENTLNDDIRIGDYVKISRKALKDARYYHPNWGKLVGQLVSKAENHMPYVSAIDENDIYIRTWKNDILGDVRVPKSSIIAVKHANVQESTVQDYLKYFPSNRPGPLKVDRIHSDSPIDLIGTFTDPKYGRKYKCFRWKDERGKWVYNVAFENEELTHTGYYDPSYIFGAKGIYFDVKQAMLDKYKQTVWEKRKKQSDKKVVTEQPSNDSNPQNIIHQSHFTPQNVDQMIQTLERGIATPYKNIYKSTLGGENRVSIIMAISLDRKENWTNNIFENSPYIKMIWNVDGSLEAVSKGTKIPIKFRRTKCIDVNKCIEKINKYISNIYALIKENKNPVSLSELLRQEGWMVKCSGAPGVQIWRVHVGGRKFKVKMWKSDKEYHVAEIGDFDFGGKMTKNVHESLGYCTSKEEVISIIQSATKENGESKDTNQQNFIDEHDWYHDGHDWVYNGPE